MADKHWWDDYEKEEKPKGHWWDDGSEGETAANNIIRRVKTWLENHNNYLTNYKNRFSGRKNSYEDAYVSDSGAWLDTITKQKSNFDAEYKNILAYMDQYSDYLDANWVKNVRHTLNSAWNQQNSIVRSSQKDNEYWMSFTPNEEQIAAGYDTAAKVYGNWQAERKQYDYDLNYDVDAAMLELEGLKKEREAYWAEEEARKKEAQENESFWDKMGRWMGTTPDTTIPLAGVSNTSSNESRTKYDSQISALEEQIERSRYLQGYEGYMNNMDASDYAAGSQYRSTRTKVAMEDAMWGFGNTMYDKGKLFGDFYYDYINRNEDALDVATVNDVQLDAYILGLDQNFLHTMTEDELGVYNYLYNTQGPEAAKEFLTFINSELTYRQRRLEEAEWAAMAKEDPFGMSVVSVMRAPLKGLSYLGQVTDFIDDGKIDQNAAYNRHAYTNTAIRNQVSTMIEQSGKWGGVGSFAYNTGMSMADFLYTTGISGGNQALSLAIMGTGAAADTTIAAKDRGLDDAEAFTLGTIAGIAEVAMERISLGAWLDGDMSEGALRYVLKNALSEGGEEVGTTAINLFADVIIAADKSELNMAVQEYMKQGKSESEAFGLALADQAAQMGMDFLGGFLSGSAIGGGTYTGSKVGAHFKYGDIAKNSQASRELVSKGLKLDPDNKYIQKVQGKLDKGKNLTAMQVRNVLAANREQITANDMKLIRAAAEKRLTDLGQTEDVSKLAELATKWATGGKLTLAEKRLLTSSKYGSRVASELMPKNIASGEYTTDWAEEIGTRKVNREAYNKKAIDMVKAVVEEMKALGTYQSLEKRVGEEAPAQVSATGKAVIRGTDEEIDLTAPKVKSISEKSVILDVNGKDVNIDDIDFADEDQWNMFNALKKIEHITPAVASSMIANLDMTKPVWGQLNGMDEAFTYGYHNYSEEDLKAGNFTGNLTEDQLKDAYNLGKYVAKDKATAKSDDIKKMRTAADVAAEKAAQKDGKGKKLTITYNHGNGVIEDIDAAIENMELEDEQRAGIEVAKLLHKMGIGTNFEFFTSYFSENKKDEDGNPLEVFTNEMGEEDDAYAGLYLAADGKIRINLKAYSGTKGLALNAMSHELVHFIKDWSFEKYNTLATFLAKAYGESGLTMNQRVLREQARLKDIRGEEVGYDEAHEEVVANALNRMLEDGKVLEKLAELKKQDKGLFKKLMKGIKEFINNFMSAYRKNKSLYWDTVDLMEMKEAFEQIQNLFAEALADASENFQASLAVQEAAIESLGENAKVETNSDGQLLLASNESGNVQMYSEQTWQNGGRTKLEAALRQNGHTAEEIKETLSYVDDALDYIKILAAGYAQNMGYNALSDHLAADIVTNVKTGKQVMSAIVNNGDYPVNIDLALICKKRVAYMNLMNRLIKDGIFDKVNYDGAAIAEVNEILRDNGFETACLGCFVESRRLQFQTWAETIVSEWNAEVEKRNPNAKNFGFAQGKMENLTDADIDALTKELESVKKNDQGNVNLGQGNSVTRMGRLLDALPSLQKKLTVEDLLTPDGLTALRKHDGSLFSIVKSRYGAASPKIVQDFNPYASEIAMLTFANVKSITNNAVKGAQAYVNEVKGEYGKLKKNKGESKDAFKQRKQEHEQRIQDEAMRRYLYDIGGARIQSFSDFMIENIFDYIQIFADLAAKRLPLHGYSKEIVCLRLFGMTGAKWNGSLIAHVERSMGKELAGLLPAGTKDGIPVKVNGKDYVIGFDDVARNLATNGKSFIQSIGMKDIIALQLDPRYSPYVGNITIGVSDAQILAMLDNPLFRMVIPYHASGMLPIFAKLVGVDMYNDYTDYQNTTVRQYYDLNGNAVSELKNAKGETVKADTSYAFNAEIQKTKDARVAADNYLKWCAERHPVYDGSNLVGYATFNPKFSSSPYGTDFTRHKNYYKLLEDFNTYDCITEASTVQGAVTMNFPSEENRLTKQQMEEYKNALRETGIFTEADIKKYAKKADMTFKEIIKAEVGNRANYAATQAPKWESTVNAVEAKLLKDHAREMRSSQQTDRAYIDAVNRGDMETAQRMVDEYAKAAGFTTNGYHGSRTPGFTVVDKYSWLWLARDKSVASGYGTRNTVESKGKPHNENGIYAMRYNLGNNLKVYADGASWGELPVTEDEYPGVYADEETGDITTDAMAEWAARHGYDSITFVDVDDGGLTTVDVVFDPNRDAKSADPVTYDDSGNVIPLSQRFNTEKDDIRYSSQETDADSVLTRRASNKELAANDDTALYIKNTDKANYIGMIFNGAKTEETRSRRTLDAFIGKDFYVTDGKYVYGSIVLGEPHQYTEEEFRKKKNQLKHRVPVGDVYDIKPGGTKWAYPIESYKKFDKPKKLSDSKEYRNSFQARQVMYSSQQTDLNSEGKLLSKEQQEFFKDSIVRDENGKLLVMFHGTAYGGYTVFDTYGSEYGLFGAGSYFTDSKKIAESYTYKHNRRGNDNKQVYETYLNIKNPMDMDAEANPREWRMAFNEVDFPLSGTNEEFFRVMEEYFADEWMQKWEVADAVIDAMRFMGYDGITHIGGGRVNPDGERHRVYIAFDPEQIKSVDNKNPTSDPDIHFSTQQTDNITNRHLLANAFEGISKSSIEYEMIQEYKENINHLNEQEKKLSELNELIRKLTFGNADVDAAMIRKINSLVTNRPSATSDGDIIENGAKVKAKDRNNIGTVRGYDSKSGQYTVSFRSKSGATATVRLSSDMIEPLQRNKDKVEVVRKDGESDKSYYKRLLVAEANATRDAISKQDKLLLNMEASEPLRKVIERERAKASQKTKDHVKEIVQNKKLRAEQTELRHKIRKAVRDLDKILNRGNKKQNVKEDMKGFVSKALELADYLFTDHISNDELIRRGITVRMTPREEALVKETEDILSKLYDNADNLTDEEFKKLDAKRKANEEKLRDLLTAQRNERLNTPVYNLFNDLVTEYASLKNSNQDAVKAAYDPNVERFLRSYIGETNGETDSDRKTLLQNMRVADMTTDELWKLHNAYKMVLHSVRDANKLWVKGKTETIEQMASRIMGDFSKRKTPNGKVATVLRNLSNKMGWDYEKLYYALDRIGSDAFTELVMNIANSENTVMQDVIEAALFRDQMVEKYGFNNWAVNKEIDREFLDNTGKKFKLTLGQMMALYAYSRRDGAWDHIEYGGFVFGEAALTNPRPADSYKLSKEQCEAITNLLTKEQKGYVEEMQKFLSETMGAKGNEVSMMLYGIKMFEEKNYFPIHIAGQFKAQANESQAKAAAGFSSMSNAGFTHAQNPNAKAPFVLEGFNEIWVDHVNEMSRYHGTVPALEDMRRVMNRSSYSETGAESMAIKQMMENSYGKEAVDYFDSLYREANSGAITDKLQKKSKKLLGLFRKNSVAYSLSVLVQQPGSIVRAYAMIPKKYFGFKGFGAITSGVVKAVSNKWTKAHTNAYNEMMKYAPGVTLAKEIGGFDTATGGSIRSYLLDTNKKFGKKWKTGTVAEKGGAVMSLVDDNAIANLPNLADKIAWIEIWNACKRETVATHKDLTPNSEEFMQAVGERFTEVIRATQVYDSIFAKSPMLKSKNLAVQYLVSFMNEPNTVANMAEKAMRDVTKGNLKGGLKTAVAVIHSIIFTNVLKSIIYAMRDDDEDESYTEKLIEAVAGNLMDDFNPLNYIPLVRDAWSLAQGYDVERADMAIVADALDALNGVINNAFTDTDDMTEEQLAEFDKKVTEANWKLVESITSFFGIPIKNVRREINGIIDHARIASANAGKTTAHSAWEKFRDAVIESIPFMSTDSKQDKLYDAIISGDTDYVNRLKAGYKDEDAYNSAVRKALRENDPRIHEAAQAYYSGNIAEYKRIFKEIRNDDKHNIIGFDNTMEAVMSEVSAIKGELEPKTESSAYTATDFVNAIMVGSVDLAQTMKEDIISYKVENGESRKEAEKAFNQSVSTSTRNAFDSGLLDEAGTEKMLQEYAGMDEEEAAEKASYWAFIKAHPQYRGKLSESNVDDYHEFAEPAEIPLDVFVQYLEGTSGLETIRDEWGDEVKSKREQVLEVIDSLPLTWQQKDALYLAAGYAESKIWDVPW